MPPTVELADTMPFPSRTSRPTEVKAAEFAAPASSAPSGGVLPFIATTLTIAEEVPVVAAVPGGVALTGTNSGVRDPIQPNEPTTSLLPPQVRASSAGTIASTPAATITITRFNI